MIRGYLYLFLFNFSSRLCLSFPSLLSFIERTSPLSRRLLQSVNSNLLRPSFSSIPFEPAVSSVNLSFSFSSLIPSPRPLRAFVPRHVDFREASIVSSRFFFFSTSLPIFTLPGLTVRLGDPLSTFARLDALVADGRRGCSFDSFSPLDSKSVYAPRLRSIDNAPEQLRFAPSISERHK